MGFRINTNTTSIAAQRNLATSNRQLASNSKKLASGSRITQAADDAAGLAISEKMKATIRSARQANRNANDGVSMIQVAEGGFNEISNMLIRLRELAMQSASDTVGNRERAYTDLEYQNLIQEVQRISEVTEFNGRRLIDGTGENYDFQIGINNDQFQDRITFDAARLNGSTAALGLDGLGVNSKEGAQTSLSVLDEAIDRVSGNRAILGALQNRLQSTSNNLEVFDENLQAANSRIRDVDYASATADQARNNILNQAGVAVLAQANTQGQAALNLIG